MNWLYTIIFAGLAFSSHSTPVTSVQNNSVDPVAVTAAVRSDETERFEQTYPFSANGRVHVSNVNGSITMEAWDRNEIKLVYVKKAESRDRLADVEVRVEARQDSFDVETDYGNWRRDNGGGWRNNGKISVEFQLMVPRGAVLSEIETVNGSVEVSNFTNRTHVSAVNGSVNASNLRGTAHLETVNGEVRGEFERLEPGSKISLETVNGQANVVIPSDSNATIKADSVNGNISNDFGLPVRKGKYVGRDLYGKLGTGEVQIKLESVNGGLTISRKNDGRSPSPAVDLLPQKGKDDEDWDDNDDDNGNSSINAARMNKEIAKSVKQSSKETAKAAAESAKQIEKMQPEIARITAEAVENAAKAIDVGDLQRQMRDVERLQREGMPAIADAFFANGIPRIEKRSDSIKVNGTPQVTVDGKNCSVSVRGWDKNEVQYNVIQFSNPRRQAPLNINENHSDKSVTISVQGSDNDRGAPSVRIEINVPKRSNLKIDSGGTIRIEGVSGDVKLSGGDESINVRDGDGTLTVKNADGRIRVIGFRGQVDAESGDGSISLEGDFQSLIARSGGGDVTVTLPDGTGADVDSNCDSVLGEGVDLKHVDTESERNRYTIGSGERTFKIDSEGQIRIRSTSSLKSNS